MDLNEFNETNEYSEYENELFFEEKFDDNETAEEENDKTFDWFAKFVYRVNLSKISGKETISLFLEIESLEEEFGAAAKKIQDIKNKIFEGNLFLVLQIAYIYNNISLHLKFKDLVQEGSMGLFRAIKKFKVRRNFAFSTYAAWWIKGYILNAIANTGFSICRIPIYTNRKLLKLFNAKNFKPDLNGEFLSSNEDKFTEEEIEDLTKIYAASRFYENIDPILENENGENRLSRVFKIHSAKSPEEIICADKNDFEIIGDVLKNPSLSLKEKNVIEKYFGIGTEKKFNLQEIGDIYGVTKECVRLWKIKILKKVEQIILEENKKNAVNF